MQHTKLRAARADAVNGSAPSVAAACPRQTTAGLRRAVECALHIDQARIWAFSLALAEAVQYPKLRAGRADAEDTSKAAAARSRAVEAALYVDQGCSGVASFAVEGMKLLLLTSRTDTEDCAAAAAPVVAPVPAAIKCRAVESVIHIK